MKIPAALLLCVTLCSMTHLYAQIEVTVQDTIAVPPNQFEYHLNFSNSRSYDPNDPNFSIDEYRRQTRQNEEKLQELLTKGRFEYVELPTSNSVTLSVVANAADITRFAQIIGAFKKESNLNWRVNDRRYVPLEALEQMLNRKLIQQAQNKAQQLGALANLSVTGISGIFDAPMRYVSTPDEEGGWAVYPPTLSNEEMFLAFMKQPGTLTYEKGLTIRFNTE